MKNNFFSLRFALLMVLFLGTAYSTLAYDIVKDGIYYYIIGTEARVCDNGENSYSGDVTIPAVFTHNGQTYLVTYICSGAFRDCTELKSVFIPNTVTVIGGSF